MISFKEFHPIVIFIYFVVVISFAMIFMHPLYLFISLFSGLAYMTVLKGDILKSLKWLFPTVLFTAIVNPLFNHQGMTIITYMPGGNPLTLESIIYGLVSGVMLYGVLCWFSCFNVIMTSDKLTYLFGRIAPSLSLVFSMSLRFVPRLKNRLKAIATAQKSMGRDIKKGKMADRLKTSVVILGALISWALENSVETADSMKSRGYGLKGRTAFSIFRFKKRDFMALCVILLCGSYIVACSLSGEMGVVYFPQFRLDNISIGGVIAYLVLYMMPVFVDVLEVKKWKAYE